MMNEQYLMAVNNYGKIFTLSTFNSQWKQFPHVGNVDIKHISAVENYVWSIGGDNQTYLLVHDLDEVIRIKEEVYENERWMPVGSFSKRLLPTDRYHWSSENGKEEKLKVNIKLPSFVWQWEHEWKLDTKLEEKDLDDDGWTYAIDFCAKFYPTKRWNSCVRRRKWYRNRIYTGTNSWCIISPLHKDFTQEPFICVSIGGQKMPGTQFGFMMVWAITTQGRIFYRKNVNKMWPEGGLWVCVPTKDGSESRYIDCGPTGSVWVVLWNGIVQVRKEVCAEIPQGKEWITIESPESDTKITQLSVGFQSVWAITNDSRVWYRKGIDQNHNEGTCWVKLNSFMFSVSVAPNDQVFSVGLDRHLYFRSEISEDEPTGKKWVHILASVEIEQPIEQKKNIEGIESWATSSSFTEPSHSAPTRLTGNVSKNNLNLNAKEINPSQRRVSAWSPKHSIGSLLGMEAKPDSFIEVQNNITTQKPKTTFWSSIVAGSIEQDVCLLSQWFNSPKDGENSFKSKWRREILDKLIKLRLQEKEFQNITSFAL
ncbi:Peroxin/Ferlin domain,Beta-propeller repeat TECPR,Peroxin domain [Cinara cedri]|uniref:Peroxin/Ferlin domain,Beta-propeller repeat TECPR,Peroxin domain n=1 Tax=Cinara cedri TaxID=506608 RepID=A0A5E4M6V6_9HEMI|nr:Peroxin/Ferlin domain,Beta-propeller repeat TECPR,Peroxin domain [Cinara cedri]